MPGCRPSRGVTWCAAAFVCLLGLALSASAQEAAPAPAQPQQAAPAAPQPTANLTLRERLARSRLARSPEMFGDQFLVQQSVILGLPGAGFDLAGLQAPAHLRGWGQKISENNHVLPRDRVFYVLNLYDDALRYRTNLDPPDFDQDDRESLYRSTIGFEKTFFDGQCSFEMRMPFDTNVDYARAVDTNTFGYDGGSAGNLLLIGKRLFYRSEQVAIGGGLGLELPTGDDSRSRSNTASLNFQNEAVYFSPFLGALLLPSDRWFITTIGQLQVAANGNPVRLNDGESGFNAEIAKISPPTAGIFDVAVGRWLFRDRTSGLVTGVALVGELHQIVAFQETDSVATTTVAGDPGVLVPGPARGFVLGDHFLATTTFTLGIHAQLGGLSSLRLGGVIPLEGAPYDFETMVQLNVGF